MIVIVIIADMHVAWCIILATIGIPKTLAKYYVQSSCFFIIDIIFRHTIHHFLLFFTDYGALLDSAILLLFRCYRFIVILSCPFLNYIQGAIHIITRFSTMIVIVIIVADILLCDWCYTSHFLVLSIICWYTLLYYSHCIITCSVSFFLLFTGHTYIIISIFPFEVILQINHV